MERNDPGLAHLFREISRIYMSLECPCIPVPLTQKDQVAAKVRQHPDTANLRQREPRTKGSRNSTPHAAQAEPPCLVVGQATSQIKDWPTPLSSLGNRFLRMRASAQRALLAISSHIAGTALYLPRWREALPCFCRPRHNLGHLHASAWGIS